MVDIQGVKFPGYGRCIYCGSTGPLKDEHIIPFSLGGKAVIEAASCGDCEKVTSYLDGYLARQIFHEYRAHAGMKSRRPKERPSELAATIVKPDGTHEVRTFAPKEHPYFLIMPVWNLPGILLNEEPTNNFEIMQAHAYWWIPESMQKTAEMEREQVRATGTINYTAFARGIARISYCQAVAHLGLASFDAMDSSGAHFAEIPVCPLLCRRLAGRPAAARTAGQPTPYRHRTSLHQRRGPLDGFTAVLCAQRLREPRHADLQDDRGKAV